MLLFHSLVPGKLLPICSASTGTSGWLQIQDVRQEAQFLMAIPLRWNSQCLLQCIHGYQHNSLWVQVNHQGALKTNWLWLQMACSTCSGLLRERNWIGIAEVLDLWGPEGAPRLQYPRKVSQSICASSRQNIFQVLPYIFRFLNFRAPHLMSQEVKLL